MEMFLKRLTINIGAAIIKRLPLTSFILTFIANWGTVGVLCGVGLGGGGRQPRSRTHFNIVCDRVCYFRIIV